MLAWSLQKHEGRLSNFSIDPRHSTQLAFDEGSDLDDSTEAGDDSYHVKMRNAKSKEQDLTSSHVSLPSCSGSDLTLSASDKSLSACSSRLRLLGVLSQFRGGGNKKREAFHARNSNHGMPGMESTRTLTPCPEEFDIDEDRDFLRQCGVALRKHRSARKPPVTVGGVPLSVTDQINKAPQEKSSTTKASSVDASVDVGHDVDDGFELRSVLPELLPNCGTFKKIDLKDRVCEKFRTEQINDFMRQEKELTTDEDGNKKVINTNPAMLGMCRLLRQVGLFHEYTEPQLCMLVRNMQIRRVQPNEWVFRKGEDAHCTGNGGFYVIIHGRVEVILDEGKDPVSIMTSGGSFGDKALLNDQPRSASIRTKDHCIFGVIHKDDFMRYRHHADQVWALQVARFLKMLHAFSHWELKSLICFAGMAKSRRMEVGKEFFQKNEIGYWVLIIRSGTCEAVHTVMTQKKIVLPTSLERGTKEYTQVSSKTQVVVARLERGDIFGDTAALQGNDTEEAQHIRGISFNAVTPGEALLIDVESFRRCAKKWGYTSNDDKVVPPRDEVARKARQARQWKQFRQDYVHGLLKDRKVKGGPHLTPKIDKAKLPSGKDPSDLGTVEMLPDSSLDAVLRFKQGPRGQKVPRVSSVAARASVNEGKVQKVSGDWPGSDFLATKSLLDHHELQTKGMGYGNGNGDDVTGSTSTSRTILKRDNLHIKSTSGKAREATWNGVMAAF